MTKINFFKRILSWIKRHKVKSTIILVVVLIATYWGRSISSGGSMPQYTLSMARMGSITETVTGSGQISASNQTDIQSLVSGTIKSINVSVGQKVRAGELIAVIDYTNALVSLENARISLAKITQPAKEADINIAKNNLHKAYDSAFNTVASVFLDLPSLLSGMRDLLYSQTGYLSNQHSSSLSSTGALYRESAGRSYDLAYNRYQIVLKEYESITRSSATTSLDNLISHTYEMIKSISEATTNAQNAINFISTSQPGYQASSLSTALSNVTAWANQANSGVSNIISAQNSILSASNSLNSMIAGNDELDIRSAKLNFEQAQRTYDNYFIRAPYDGVIGRIPVNVYGQASSGTTIATIVGQQKMANISLNEIDATKVRVGQTVDITFDAIDNFTATGTVSVVDQIGTVSSGVVSYGIKIAIDTEDERIRPGMSANTTIVTFRKDDILIVPSGAIRKAGNESYILTLNQNLIRANNPQPSFMQNSNGTTTRNRNTLNQSQSSNATTSSQNRWAGFMGQNNNSMINRSITIETNTEPIKITVVTGKSDDTNTEIVSGLDPGQFVITRISSASSARTTNAPSILQSVGGTRTGAGAIRTNIQR